LHRQCESPESEFRESFLVGHEVYSVCDYLSPTRRIYLPPFFGTWMSTGPVVIVTGDAGEFPWQPRD
jgi:hypothetical protein